MTSIVLVLLKSAGTVQVVPLVRMTTVDIVHPYVMVSTLPLKVTVKLWPEVSVRLEP